MVSWAASVVYWRLALERLGLCERERAAPGGAQADGIQFRPPQMKGNGAPAKWDISWGGQGGAVPGGSAEAGAGEPEGRSGRAVERLGLCERERAAPGGAQADGIQFRPPQMKGNGAPAKWDISWDGRAWLYQAGVQKLERGD